MAVLVRKAVLEGPAMALLRGAVGASVAFLQELLVLAFQLVIGATRRMEAPPCRKRSGLPQIGAIDLRICISSRGR